MKVAILQFDERTTDENIHAVLNVNRKYAAIHGYDHIFKAVKEEDTHQHELDGYLGEYSDKRAFKQSIYDYRMKMVEQYMNDYDYLMYLDTDCLVNNPNIKIEDLVDPDHSLFMFRDGGQFNTTVGLYMIAQVISSKCKLDGVRYLREPFEDLKRLQTYECSAWERLAHIAANPEGLATGFMIFDCNYIRLKEFCDDFNRFYPLFGMCEYDQGCIPTLLRREKYKDMLKILPSYMHGNPFEKVLQEFKLDMDKAFVCHFYSHSSEKEACKKYIEEVKANKWWKGIF